MCALVRSWGKNKGFTFIETALAIALAAILATTATPIFIDTTKQAKIASEDTVSGHVHIGITLDQMQSLALTGVPTYPQNLDNAPIGMIANPNHPFFKGVLQFPITTGWRKEAANSYRSPTGRLFVYNPENGTFLGEGEERPANSHNLGEIVYQDAGIAFYDTGAIADPTSELAYLPSLSGDTVTLTLASGAQINTHEDASALITLSGGETLKVADIHKPAFFKLTPEGQDSKEEAYSYLWVDNAQASEGKHTTRWHKKEYQVDKKGGTFYYEYDLNGEYAGGSLKKEVGFIYRTDYQSSRPQVSKGSWVKKENGDYAGTIHHRYDYASNAKSGYDHREAKYRYAFEQNGSAQGSSETNYTYNSDLELYQSELKGNHQHTIAREASSGPWRTEVAYDYTGKTEYDKKNELYKSEFNYRYQDGRDLTYLYAYNHNDKTYEWSVTDNQTGKTTRRTNQKEKVEKEGKQEKKD